MTAFILMGLATVTALLWLVRPLLRSRAAVPRAEYDRRIYRDQLAELERDLARGTIGPAEAEASRTEIARRLLAADAAAAREVPPGRALEEVEPGGPAPRDEDEAAYAGQVEQLAAILAGRPGDLTGHRLLANGLARLGRFAEAHPVQARVIALAGAEATADEYATLAEMMIFAARGYVSPEAEAALAEALTRNPAHVAARYYAGHAAAQRGRPEVAYELWSRLVAEGPAEAPWIAPVLAELRPLAAALGRPLPEGTASEAPADAAATIRGMVEGLAARLAAEGGPAEDWARLVRSLGVLGERDRAAAIAAEALTVFAGRADDLALLRAAAAEAGVADRLPAPPP